LYANEASGGHARSLVDRTDTVDARGVEDQQVTLARGDRTERSTELIPVEA